MTKNNKFLMKKWKEILLTKLDFVGVKLLLNLNKNKFETF